VRVCAPSGPHAMRMWDCFATCPTSPGRAVAYRKVGEVALADVPRMMRDHDASHTAEIIAWSQEQ
jgi:hypothetical protein